ncbi:TIGR02099 family protein [Ectopseudomonas toyotomiensis]|uniref:TIGR02099 family protein n=1 Tax=Ectopseudomonas toyotomiensis TaxID=554344 RepID=A0A1I5Y2Z5_9GAMM|nr:YhdP family protein [Pseudomonas toyotomiensis]PIA69372.1 TIGR02099 family protein [Pseudomonas toyotomiensis]SFQ38480.1 TIGR02099 family protein [Pseudomonas toyotomiensis]
MNALARLFAALLRWGLGLCAAVLVLAALYVSLGRELVPLVAEYRLELEDRATAQLGVPVRIGRLEGRWQGFAPVLEAHDVRLGSEEDGLSLERVRLVPDVGGSLLARQPRIAHLQFDGLQLNVQQNADGGWQLQGVPQRSGPELNVEQLLEQLQIVHRISLLDSRVVLQPLDQEPLLLSYVNLSLRYGSNSQRLDGRLLLPDGQPVALRLRTRMQPRTWREAQSELYLSLPQSDWATWLPKSLLGDWQLQRLQAGGELWLEGRGLALDKGALRLHAPELVGGQAKHEAVTLKDLAFNAFFSQDKQGVRAQIDSLALTHGEQRIGELHLNLKQGDEGETDERWALSADRLDLAAWAPLVQALMPMPDQARDVLVALAPVGAVNNLLLDYYPQREGAERLQFAANLDRVGIQAYQGAPAAENVSGSASGNMFQGELRLNSENFALHLDQLFPKPWRYRHAQARLSWDWSETGLTLYSPYMRVDGEEGQVAGDMLIRLLRDPEAEDYMDLRVGMRDGDASYTEKYLPSRAPGMSAELDQWLKTAIRAGHVEEGYFQYQGSLNKGASLGARSLSLFFKVKDAELAFQPAWPSLREGVGEVLIEDDAVRVRLQSGRLQESTVSNVVANIPLLHDGKPPRLQLDGEVQSSLSDAIKLLQEAPLGTAEIFDGWQGEGPLAGRLQLDIPLQKGQPPGVVVDFATEGANLKLANPDLQLSKVQGAFRFDSAAGLSAPDVRAEVFGRQVRGNIRAEGARGQARTLFDLRGQVQVDTLSQWLGGPAKLPASGLLPYRLRLTLDGDDSKLRVDSNLRGVAIDLPAPFGKAAQQERDTDWRMTLAGRERRYWANYGELVSLSLAAPPGALADGRGELVLGGGAAGLPPGQGLRVRGRLDELDLDAWKQLGTDHPVKVDADSQRLLRSARLDIGRFRGFGQEVEQLTLGLEREAQGWALQLDSELAAGRVLLADAEGVPIRIDLRHVRLPAPDPEAAKASDAPDPLTDFDPSQIPALDIAIERVQRGDKVLGAWSLKVRPEEQGVRFEELDLDLQGLKIGGSAGWRGTPGNTSSWYKGRLQGKDLSDVLKAWDFAPSVTSESFRVDADGNWPGSPAWFSLKRFSGNLDASLRKGQFVEVQGSAQALRVFGLLNFNSIGRRLRLDFSDLLGKGLSYDRVKGNLQATNGLFMTHEPITLSGPSSNLELNGNLDMRNERIDAKLLVTLPVTNNLPLAALIVGAPAVGGALFVVDKLLGDKVARFASVQYDVKGPMQDPEISFDKPFEKPQ